LPLISGAELRRELEADPPTMLDVRWELAAGPQRAEYAVGHIPGAAFVDLDADLADPPGAGGRHPLPSADRFTAAMRVSGVSGDRAVVAYDAVAGLAAARAWWLLRYFGHPNVRLLDGGLSAWTQIGGKLEAGQPAISPGTFTAEPEHMPVVDADRAAALARTGVLLDARAPARFRGETEPIDPVAGHIPGARNRPTATNIGADGSFAAPAQLREAFAALGVTGETETAAYCGSGVTAAHLVLALELAGIPAALYPGSWSEWVTDPDRPVATGP
jgi:thiosulfate/3-mercaptopyruvate sulfurtransferase